MWEDPIVAEVHRTRRELAEKFDFDVNAIVTDIRKRQAALGDRLVSLAKRAKQNAEDVTMNVTARRRDDAG
jgi:hypothetical protein